MNVLYGTAGGITAANDQLWIQGDLSFYETEAVDYFGQVLATGYSAKYAPKDYRLAVGDVCDPGPEQYHYYTDVLEDTHVAEVTNGYRVNLFYGEKYGCGPFPVSSVIVEVSLDGAISELPKSKLFEQGKPCPGEKIVQCCVD